MLIDASVHCPIYDSFRVRQVAGMFDLNLGEKASERFSVEIPDIGEDWTIGLIVGPSGSGKTTIAAQAFGNRLCQPTTWPEDRAVVDCLGEAPIKQIVYTLTAVGFSSPPAWVKPYAALSNGEKFRCDLARALLMDDDLVVFDEFTSVVDRTVARIGSSAVARAIRSGNIKRRFVAISCHYDIAPWLEPDWVLDMGSGTLARGRLQRPGIRLDISRCRSSAWKLFSQHHYLSGSLHPSAQCYLATVEEHPAAFCATLPNPPRRNCRRITRLVVLPDFQGVGIGMRLLDFVAQLADRDGQRISITTSHPAMIGGLSRSPRWRCRAIKRNGFSRHSYCERASAGRVVCSFRYVGEMAGRMINQHGQASG
jgi:energy-coupling factor transporter ATP-binding protein EcfA2